MDGAQHLEGSHVQNDRRREVYLAALALKVLRFNSRKVMKESDAVIEVICRSAPSPLAAEVK